MEITNSYFTGRDKPVPKEKTNAPVSPVQNPSTPCGGAPTSGTLCWAAWQARRRCRGLASTSGGADGGILSTSRGGCFPNQKLFIVCPVLPAVAVGVASDPRRMRYHQPGSAPCITKTSLSTALLSPREGRRLSRFPSSEPHRDPSRADRMYSFEEASYTLVQIVIKLIFGQILLGLFSVETVGSPVCYGITPAITLLQHRRSPEI